MTMAPCSTRSLRNSDSLMASTLMTEIALSASSLQSTHTTGVLMLCAASGVMVATPRRTCRGGKRGHGELTDTAKPGHNSTYEETCCLSRRSFVSGQGSERSSDGVPSRLGYLSFVLREGEFRGDLTPTQVHARSCPAPHRYTFQRCAV